MGRKPYQESKIISICLSIIRYGTYLALFTPLIFSSRFFFPFVAPKSLYFMALSEIVFFAWLILLTIQKKYRPKFNYLLLALLFYLFLQTLSAIFGVNPSYSFWSKPERMTGVLMMLHLFCFFLVLSTTFEKEDFKKLCALSVFVALIVGLYAFANRENPTMRRGGTIGNDSFLGTYLIFNLFFTLYLFFKEKEEMKIFSAIAFLFIFAILFSSEARAAKFSSLGGLSLFSLLYLTFVPESKKLKILGTTFLAIFLILSLISISLLFKSGSFVQKKFIKLATRARLVVWGKAFKGFLERPLLGWGPENFEYPFAKYFNPCMFLRKCGGEIWFDRAHNIIFDTLVTTGIFGLVSYLSLFFSSLFIIWERYLREKEFLEAGIFTSLFAAYFVQNLTVFDMISSYLVFFLSLAFLASFKEKERDFEIKKESPLLISTITLIFFVSFYFFIFSPTRANFYVISALKSPEFSKQRLDFSQKALSSSSLGKFQIREFFANEAIKALYRTKKSSIHLRNEVNFLASELRKSIKECPIDFRSYLRLGQLYTFYSRFDRSKISKAEKILEKAIKLSPTNQQGYWYLAQLRIYQGNFKRGISLAQKAVNLEPNLKRSHLILVQIIKNSGNLKLAEEKMKEAIKINPKWEDDLRKILENTGKRK